MNKCLLIFYAIVVLIVSCFGAQDRSSVDDIQKLSGVLPPIVKASTYLVTSDIFVSPGSNVTIEAGTVFLFEGFTGLHVQGVLYVKGTKTRPVIMTSKNDSVYVDSTSMLPAPFDWNGVDIYESALGTSLNHCHINYSVYGVRSQTEFVRMDNVSFSNNGKSEFSIKGERKDIDVQPYSYAHESITKAAALIQAENITESSDDESAAEPSMGEDPPNVIIRDIPKLVRYSGLLLFLGGSVAGTVFGEQCLDAHKKLKDLSALDDTKKYTYTSSDWENVKSTRDDKATKASIAGGIGCLGLTTFLITFAF